ncbi:MAG TPA: hypothetical protein VN767_12245 [Streptosporangiaceae bacterium]|nr:hypothetical protein [Streptosporangiaceae bacterium]
MTTASPDTEVSQQATATGDDDANDEPKNQATGDAKQAAATPPASKLSLNALTAILTRVEISIRTHWIASILVALGLVMRFLTQAAYQPAIIYIDTLKYLYDAWPGSDPVGYKVPLKMILSMGGNLSTVEFIQHLIGIAMAITIYAVLVRRGVPRWLAAIAMAPILFDAYQLQAEAMIMPDIWFEAVILAGVAVLLWKNKPTLWLLICGAGLLGASTGVRQIGEVTIIPAVAYAIVLGGGLKKMAINVAAVACAFGLAIVLYMGAADELTGHFRISYSSSSLTFGRTAQVVDCAALNVSPHVKLLCPTKWQQAQGPDWLEHSSTGPLRTFTDKLPSNLVNNRPIYVSEFNHAVEKQQPLRLVGAVLRDAVKLFALTRDTSPGDTPIWRWQFHGYFPTFSRYVFIQNNTLYVTLPQTDPRRLSSGYGVDGPPSVDVPVARFLRSYQTNGGYTPGPLLALSLITGLIGSLLLVLRRRITDQVLVLGLGALCFFATAVVVIGMSDAFEFSWRYQLPALVTMPPAGALGLAAIIMFIRNRRQAAGGETVSERAPELAAPAQ